MYLKLMQCDVWTFGYTTDDSDNTNLVSSARKNSGVHSIEKSHQNFEFLGCQPRTVFNL